MSGFMNAEIEALRLHLQCGNCGAKFEGSDSQARKHKYEGRLVYCSDACSYAVRSRKAREQVVRDGRKLRKGVLTGPCKHCGEMFESMTDKTFCSLNCYTKSNQFREMQSKYWTPTEAVKAKIAESLKKGKDVPCLECGEDFYQKLPTKQHRTPRKFCCTICYRSYFAKRFDRWIANPESMALPQCYDEFLDREELSCVVDGCSWHGRHLTMHMNSAHGMRAGDFKRATGFNLSTGVIARPLAQALRDRSVVGVASMMDEEAKLAALALSMEALANIKNRYVSLEGKEHAKKGRAMMGLGPRLICLGCGDMFQKPNPMGRGLYCSPNCRDKTYAEKLKEERRAKKKRSALKA